MKGKRRQHSAELKSKVAVETIRGVSTVQEIASRYEVHPTLVTKWKKEALAGLPGVFAEGPRTRDANEERFLLLGMSMKLRVLVVCHCFRVDDLRIRIISARKANQKEARNYRSFWS